MLQKLKIFLINLFMWCFLPIKYKLKFGNTKKSLDAARVIVNTKGIKNKFDVTKFIINKMEYVSDPLGGFIDIQQDLDYTLKRKWKGDCDDYALVAYRLLQVLGYNPEMLTLIRNDLRKNHVVCYAKELDNDKVFLIGTEDIQIFNDFKTLIKNKEAITYSINTI
ncbi:MAG: hypothetical protein ACOCRK_03000 [bacterium]